MYGLNAVAFVFFVALNLLAYRLCAGGEAARVRTVRALCAVLFLDNAVRYALVYPLIDGVVLIPAEFSSVAYFVSPAILLTARGRARGWAAYSGLMAGFFYYMALIVAGGPIYSPLAPGEVYLSMYRHGTLYLCGLVTIGTERCDERAAPGLMLGVALVAGWALLVRPAVDGSQQMLIYMLLDGLCVKLLLPQSSWPMALPPYYAALAALVQLTIRGFFWQNRRQYRKFRAPGDAAAA